MSTLIGILINFVGLDPIKALFWSAVINGVVAVPLMVIIMLMAMRRDVMGRFVLPRALWVMGWLCTGAMAVAGSCLRSGEASASSWRSSAHYARSEGCGASEPRCHQNGVSPHTVMRRMIRVSAG